MISTIRWFCFFLPFGLLKAVLAVVHELADRGNGIGGDLDQVQLRLGGLGHGLGDGQDTKLLSLGGDQAHFLVPDLLIDLMSRVSDGERTSLWFDEKNKGYLSEKGIRTQKACTPCGLPADPIDPFARWREVRRRNLPSSLYGW